jgi:serine/threonine protein kinase
MGEVFLAQDIRLGRKVALKLLPEGLLADREMRRRFAQEARAASALNHPNIVTIYDIGSADGRDFLAMEYVEGQSLRDVLEAGQLDVRRSLDLTAQAASALAAAHEAGIVHRDIKPENLIVNRAGQLKILDFGLAKLVERQTAPLLASSLETLAETPQPTSQGRTGTGVILGTVSYMSPEQARGQPVDHRTDVFSLGLVLYEALTGARPFSGKSAVETLHAIINEEPVSAVERNPRVPPQAVDILAKALAKDPAERYQHAADFALDLRRAGRLVESGISRPGFRVTPTPAASRRRPFLLAAGLLAVAALAAGAWYLGRSSSRPSGSELADVTLKPLTTDPGYEGEPTFSPDGETIAYVSDRTGNFEIFLKQVSGGPDVNITNNPADDVQPAFSPDGKQIAFVSTREDATHLTYENFGVPATGGGVWVMPALGGSPRRIAESGNFPSWSPDGSSLVFTGGGAFKKAIYRVSAAGGEAREIPVEVSAGMTGRFLLYPSLSPDGKWLLLQANPNQVVVLLSEGGEAKLLATGRRPVWAPDGRSIVYSTAERGKNSSLWRVPFSGGKGTSKGRGEPLTVGIAPNTQATISGDGRQIAFTALEQTFNLETLPFDAEAGRVTGERKELTAGRNDNQWKTFSPDGRSVVFANGGRIYRLEAGQAAHPLTTDSGFVDGQPRWSPDGRAVVFERAPTGAPAKVDLWLMASDGAGPRRLIEKARAASWMPDNRGLVYCSTADRYLYLYDLATRRSRKVTDEPTMAPLNTVSPDGRWIVYQSSAESSITIRARPIDGGETRVVAATPGQMGSGHPMLSPSGNWFYYQVDHKNVYRVPGPAQGWRKAEPVKVTNFPEFGLFIEDPRLSMDGKQLIYSRGKITGDLWLLRFGEPGPKK